MSLLIFGLIAFIVAICVFLHPTKPEKPIVKEPAGFDFLDLPSVIPSVGLHGDLGEYIITINEHLFHRLVGFRKTGTYVVIQTDRYIIFTKCADFAEVYSLQAPYTDNGFTVCSPTVPTMKFTLRNNPWDQVGDYNRVFEHLDNHLDSQSVTEKLLGVNL